MTHRDEADELRAENKRLRERIERLRKSVAIAALWTAEPGTTLAEIRAAMGEKQ